jgi:hypothetical protein
MRPLAQHVSFLAKQNYCQYARPEWYPIIDKILGRCKLEPTEVAIYGQMEREILNIVNYKAEVISGLTKNNKKQARLTYRDLLFIIRFEKGIGKVVTVRFGIDCYP